MEDLYVKQRKHLRKIMLGFLVVVILLPLTGFGGAWSWLLIPLLAAGAFTFRESLRLRKTVLTIQELQHKQ